MVRLLHKQHAMSDRFIAHMLSRNIRIEEDLIDQLFNSSEKRLARTLLLLRALRQAGQADRAWCRRCPQETLAKMVGHDALAREFLPEQVQETRLHRLRRRRSRSRSTARSLSVVLHD